MNDKRPALVVLSGGQDSTTCLYWARERYAPLYALTFDYGQRHAVEVKAAQRIAHMAGVEHEVLKVGPLLASCSPLVDADAQLETYNDFASMDRIIGSRVELTFVPMRNALFMTLAANRAIARDVRVLVVGVCEADNANYPDCRAEFVEAQQRAINKALGLTGFLIETPLMYLTKAGSVRLAMRLPGCMEALAYSHTCYAGEVPPCGRCHACVLRAHGFAQAGVADPLIERTAQVVG